MPSPLSTTLCSSRELLRRNSSPTATPASEPDFKSKVGEVRPWRVTRSEFGRHFAAARKASRAGLEALGALLEGRRVWSWTSTWARRRS